MKIIRSLLSVLNRCVNFLVMILLAAMVLVVFYQVITRYVFGFSSSLLQAFIIVFFVWLGIIGIGIGFRDRSHIGVEMFYNLFPKMIRKGLDVFTSLLIIAVGLLFLSEGMNLVELTLTSLLPGTSLSGSLMYICIPVCGALMIIYGVSDFVRTFMMKDKRSARKV